MPGNRVLKEAGEVKCVACKRSSYIPESAQWVGFFSSLASVFGWAFVLKQIVPNMHLYAWLVLVVVLCMGTGALFKRAATRSLRRRWNRDSKNGLRPPS